MAVSLVAVVPVLLALAHPLGGLGDGEGVPPGGGEEALASGDPLQHQGHGGGRQGEREQQDHMVWRRRAAFLLRWESSFSQRFF